MPSLMTHTFQMHIFFKATVKGADFNKTRFTNFQQNLKDDLKNRVLQDE